MEQVIRDFVTKEIMFDADPGDLDVNTSLLAEGILDSMGLVRLISFLESEYSIIIGDDNLLPQNFDTITAILELVISLKEKQ